jgi:hypothetical protein
MILDAQTFDTFDRCERRFAFERTHEPRSISPLGLLYAAVEGSLTAADPVQGSKDAIMERTQRLDVNAGDLSPISAARHVEAMAEVIALALRSRFGMATRPESVKIGEHEWRPNVFECKGELHRIILASHMDDDSLRSYAHSWGTIGELAALERAITLTVVIIGAQRGGRRHSHWAKAYQHPIQRNLRFAPRKKDSGFTENWKQVWREQSGTSAQVWLDQMRNDEVLGELIQSRRINYKGDDERMIQAGRDMLTIAQSMQGAIVEAPMRRSSCDELGKGACPFQTVCYSPTAVSPSCFPHLYRERKKVVRDANTETDVRDAPSRTNQ